MPLTVSQAIRIGAPLATVWRTLAIDFDDVQRWSPVVAASYRTSTIPAGLGCARHCDLVPRGAVDETISGWDPDSELIIDVAPTGPIARQQVTLDLRSAHAENAETAVRMSIALELSAGAAGGEDALAGAFLGVIRASLAGLRHHLVSGRPVDETTLLSDDGLFD